MMPIRAWPILALAVAWGTSAQSLSQDDVLLLARFKTHMREELSHLPNYTCLETTARSGREQTDRPMQPLDTVRLEIVYSDHHEWYGSPGGKNLSSNNPFEFIGSGMIGTGSFALTLHNVLAHATFQYKDEALQNGRKIAQYGFRIPRFLNLFQVSLADGSGTVGEEGFLWVDRQSLDLLGIKSHATEIPLDLPLRDSSTTVTYARTRIGDQNVLLPQQASVRMSKTTGARYYNQVEFTHCRAFAVQSAIHFDGDGSAPAPSAAQANMANSETLPAGLQITLQLVTPITNENSVGALIEAKVAGDVFRKGKVVIPGGAPVHGRIRRLEQYGAESRFFIGLEFTEVEVNGSLVRFYADVIHMDRNPAINPAKIDRFHVESSPGRFEQRIVTRTDLPGVVSFFVHGSPFVIPQGFSTVWKTNAIVLSQPPPPRPFGG